MAQHRIVIDGQIAGAWKRTLKQAAGMLEINPFSRLEPAEKQAVVLAARRYGEFLESPAVLA